MFGLVLPLLGTAGVGWIAGQFFGFPEEAETVLTRYVLWLADPYKSPHLLGRSQPAMHKRGGSVVVHAST